MPLHPADPFDRLLVTWALTEPLMPKTSAACPAMSRKLTSCGVYGGKNIP
jgi:hypothetical protein